MKEKRIIEHNGESCAWCINKDTCLHKKRAMEATREAIIGINKCTPAYCSIHINCDYYVRDDKEYNSMHYGERCSEKI